jgi:uncharacterized protein (DUF362 family)
VNQNTISRRDFLKGITVFSAGAWLLGRDAVTLEAGPPVPAGFGVDRAVVGIADIPTGADIEAAVRRAVELAGGIPPGIGPGKVIVIQPNLVQAGWTSGSGVIAHARVVREVIRMCLEAGARAQDVFVCEGTASFYGGQGSYGPREMTLKAFRDSGLDANGDLYDDETGVRLVDANQAGQLYPDYPGYSGPYNPDYVTHVVKPFLLNRVYVLPNLVANCDFLIRIPCIKNHSLAGITGALKLACGLAPTDIYHYPGLPFYKWALLHQPSGGNNELITNAKTQADMTLCRPPDLVVTDGLVGITNGPCGGDGGGGPVNLPPGGPIRAILAGTDPVAVDTVQALVCGYQTHSGSIPALYWASQLGLGTDDPRKIEVRGRRVSEVRRWFPAWGSARPGDRVPPVAGDLNLSLDSSLRLTAQPVGAYDASPGLCKAELYVDGVLVDSSSDAGLWTSCLLAGAAAGTHTVRVTVYDGMLNETSLTRTVSVQNGPPVASALAVPDSTRLFLGPVVFAGTSAALDAQTFFVTNPPGTSGLRVRYRGKVPSLAPGAIISLEGELQTIGGQRVLMCWSLAPQGGSSQVRPKFMLNRAVGGSSLNVHTPGVGGGTGPYNLGCLIRTSGAVRGAGQGWFVIDDSSLPGGLKVLCGTVAPPSTGSRVVVCGFSCCEETGGLIRPVVALRSPADIEQV